MKLGYALLFFFFFSSAIGAEPVSQDVTDNDWNWASGRVRKNWGPTGDRRPLHVEPYDVDTRHTQKELRPPFEIRNEDLTPVEEQGLDGLRDAVSALKTEAFQTKARAYEWQQESEKSKQRSVSSTIEKQFAQVVITHLERMGDLYDLVSLTYFLDDQKIYTFHNENDRNVASMKVFSAEQPSFKVYEGLLPPGNHRLTVQAIYQGNGAGSFSYLNDYRVRAIDEKSFTTLAGAGYQLTMTSFERGRFYTSFKNRPAFQLDVVNK